jgi:hypothetical protein
VWGVKMPVIIGAFLGHYRGTILKVRGSPGRERERSSECVVDNLRGDSENSTTGSGPRALKRLRREIRVMDSGEIRVRYLIDAVSVR